MRTRGRAACLLAIVASLVLATPRRGLALDGGALYARHCEGCHGITGRGDGPDAVLFMTRPRDLQSGFLARYSTDDLVRRIRNGIPLELALDPVALRGRAGDVEAIAAHLERLPTVNWRQMEEGLALYLDHCELCHGIAGTPDPTVPGDARPPRDLSDPAFQRDTTDAEIADVIRHGRRGMPATAPIAAAELPALIAYVRLLSPGYALYDRYCTACHGDDGRGAGSFGEAGAQPTVVFDRAYFERRDPEHVRAAIWHMLDTQRPRMPHLRGVLSDAEARAIVSYLKRAP
jgi:mono/diheme cytochrome c family protein